MSGSPFAPGTGGGSSKPSPFAGAPTHHSALHFLNVIPGVIEHFAEDVKNAAVGIPVGVIEGVRHPLRAAKQFEQATWQTWSPLFNGHVGEFAKNVYAHPLAPLLDIATVFSLGLDVATLGLSSELTAGLAGVRAATAAGEVASKTVLKSAVRDEAGNLAKAQIAPHTGASLSAAADEAARSAKMLAVGGYGKLDRAAVRSRDLRAGRSIPLTDPTAAGRLNEVRNLSSRPHRRVIQETFGHLAQHFPDVYAGGRYQRAFVSTIAHRQFAKTASVAMALKAGEALTDPESAGIARTQALAGLVANLHGHAPSAVKAAKDVPDGYAPLKAVEYTDKATVKTLARQSKLEAKAEKKRADNAEMAHALPKLQAEMDAKQELLREMHDKGIVQRGIPAHKPGAGKKAPTQKQLIEAQAAPFKEIEGDIAHLDKQIAKATAARTQHDAAVADIIRYAQQRDEFTQRGWNDHFNHAGANEDTWKRHVLNAGSIYTLGRKRGGAWEATVEKYAARDAEGNIKIVPLHTLKSLGIEAHNTNVMLKYLWENPTRIWKMIQVGWAPRVVTNNFVGNWLLYALRENPVSGTAAVWDAIRATKGEKAAIQTFRESGAHVRPWQYDLFSNEIGNTYGRDILGNPIGRGARVKQGFYPIVHKLADEPVRVAALTAFMRKDARVSALVKSIRKKHPGLSKYEALDQAVRQAVKEDPALAQHAVEHVRATAGDYVTMTKGGRVIKQAVPFYLWDKHIVKSTMAIVGDTPGRAAAIQGISNQGIQETQKLLGGAIPDFMKGAIPLSILGLNFGTHGGRKGILNTTGLNPFSTVGELAGFGEAALTGGGINPGEALLSQTTPLITSGVEYLSGTNLLTGGPKPRQGGPFIGVPLDIVDKISQVKAAKQLLSPKTETNAKGKTRLYEGDDSSQLSGLLGIPLRSVDTGAAAGVASRQNPKKKKGKSSPFAIAQGG